MQQRDIDAGLVCSRGGINLHSDSLRRPRISHIFSNEWDNGRARTALWTVVYFHRESSRQPLWQRSESAWRIQNRSLQTPTRAELHSLREQPWLGQLGQQRWSRFLRCLRSWKGRPRTHVHHKHHQLHLEWPALWGGVHHPCCCQRLPVQQHAKQQHFVKNGFVFEFVYCTSKFYAIIMQILLTRLTVGLSFLF